jgi:hypothetical protein
MLPSTIAEHYITCCSHPTASNICQNVTTNLGNLTAQDYIDDTINYIYVFLGEMHILIFWNQNKNKIQSPEKTNNFSVKTALLNCRCTERNSINRLTEGGERELRSGGAVLV